MQKLVRFRKAFYEKENDLQHGNKRKERPFPQESKPIFSEKAFQTLPASIIPKSTKKQSVKSDTATYCQLYGKELTKLSEYQQKMPDFLGRHSIDGPLRARMLDWMVQVTSSYKLSPKTYFDGVSLMDRYFQAEPESLPPSKLHIVGVQCMLIASKMEEVFPLKMKTVYEKIAHRKLPMTDLVQTQERIMRVLEYKLNSWSFFDLAMLKISIFCESTEPSRTALMPLDTKNENKHENQGQSKKMRHLQASLSYLSKFILYDYSFYTENSTLLLAQSTLKAAFEIASLLPPVDFFTSSPILIELCKQRIFKNIKQHQSKFSGLNNVFKFTDRDIVSEVEKFVD